MDDWYSEYYEYSLKKKVNISENACDKKKIFPEIEKMREKRRKERKMDYD